MVRYGTVRASWALYSGAVDHPIYTPGVAPEVIARNIAFVNWTILIGLAVGAFGAVLLGRLRIGGTRGSLTFTAFAAVFCATAALAADLGLPRGVVGSPVVADPTWDTPRRVALAAFIVLGAAWAILMARDRRAVPLGGIAMVVGSVALVAAALSWGGSPAGVASMLVWLVGLAAATGGVLAAMILAHWYLVTPKLPEAPLVTLSQILVAAIVAQIAMFVVWTATGLGSPWAPSNPFAALTGPWAFFVWMRLIIGLILPLIVGVMAVRTAQTRSMESATGLLYINVGTIAAGSILAAGLYFGAGLLV